MRKAVESDGPWKMLNENTGKSELITNHLRRSFYLISAMDETLPSWTVNTDNHTFHLFWGSDEDKAKVQKEQSRWLDYLDRNGAE